MTFPDLPLRRQVFFCRFCSQAVDNFLWKILEKNGWKWKGFAIFALSVKER
jgi:hypothetical protein